MIKLNNKNITYVALADSANSIKAPKEIWYADSNNSVKLVYRRKDALIEGEDYEKYHWLKGDENSYIDTLIGDLTNVSTITCHFFENNLPLSENRIFGREGNATYDSLMTCGLGNTAQKLTVWIRPNPSFQLDVNKDGDYIEIDLVNRIASSSLQSYSFDSSPNLKGRPLYLFGDNGYNKVFAGSIKSFIIGNKINLIPCKLLKPVPKWLDANGIRRQVGECGMIDLVSGKFYGNVNSVGTFKAVNLAEGVDYEVHQWLRAEVDTRAGMAALPVNSTNLYFKRKTIRGVNHHYFSTNGYEYYCESPILGQYFSIWNYSRGTIIYRNTDIVSDEAIIDCSSDKIYANGYEIPIYGYPITYVQFRVMSDSGMETLTSSITVDGIERYIPVKLLKSIPSKYDANGIARQAGECGMYDTVNDVFYGNVASSGSFTVSDD